MVFRELFEYGRRHYYIEAIGSDPDKMGNCFSSGGPSYRYSPIEYYAMLMAMQVRINSVTDGFASDDTMMATMVDYGYPLTTLAILLSKQNEQPKPPLVKTPEYYKLADDIVFEADELEVALKVASRHGARLIRSSEGKEDIASCINHMVYMQKMKKCIYYQKKIMNSANWLAKHNQDTEAILRIKMIRSVLGKVEFFLEDKVGVHVRLILRKLCTKTRSEMTLEARTLELDQSDVLWNAIYMSGSDSTIYPPVVIDFFKYMYTRGDPANPSSALIQRAKRRLGRARVDLLIAFLYMTAFIEYRQSPEFDASCFKEADTLAHANVKIQSVSRNAAEIEL